VQIGVRRTGPDHTWQRADHLRAAAWNALWVSAAGLGIWLDSLRRGDHSALGIALMAVVAVASGAVVVRLVAAAAGLRRFP
jgi:hypothetical protein